MSKFPGKILMLAVSAFVLSAGVALADTPSSDWNNSWGFPSPAEKANLLNQALAIEFVEEDGFDSNYYGTENNIQNCSVDGACFNGDTVAIGSQVIIDVNGDNNTVTGNDATTDGNTAAQTNNGSGSIDQNNNSNPYFD
jgi:hypothetical protein